ncbi:MAG: SGNH/GDSL hydrolase family protein [Lachnospiraceae bacterium]|nr:SGNH/GDSL hydrolase family protein [Lachnospiraceae bacterium]
MKKKIVWIVPVLLLVLTIVLSLFFGRGGKETYDVIFFGDSKIGNDRTESSVSNRLEQATGLKVFNAGVGGTTLANGGNNLFNVYTMSSLARSVYMNDFGAQKATLPKTYLEKNAILDYIPETVEGLSNIDFNKCKVFIIAHGSNDFFSKVPIDNPEDPEDEATLIGALRVSVKYLKKANPKAQIIVVSPCLTYTEDGFGDVLDYGFGTEKDYAEAEKAACAELGIDFVDFYNDSGITRDNVWDYLFDGLHPGEAGNKVMLELIMEKLK